jgi:hypothetical protein
MTAGPDGFRGTRPNQLCGDTALRGHSPMTEHRFLSIRRSDRRAIIQGSGKLLKAVSPHQAGKVAGFWKVLPWDMTAQAIRAILLAKATATTRRGLRASKLATQGCALSVLERKRAA